MRISDWSSDVCSSDLTHDLVGAFQNGMDPQVAPEAFDWIILKIAIASMKLKRTVDHRRTRVRCEPLGPGGETDLVGGIFRYLEIGRASCRERVCQYVLNALGDAP